MISGNEIVISVSNVSKCYQLYETPKDRLKQFMLPKLQRAARVSVRQYYKEFWALKDVSFDIGKGETVGIIGRNGAGKSTLLQLICNTLSPTFGDIFLEGRVAALLELGTGFNPDFTGRENIIMSAQILGISDQELNSKYSEIVEFSGVSDFIDQPVKTYSSGMVMRLAFATQSVLEPDVFIVDEALAVGDAEFQSRCYSKLGKLKSQGTTILFVSHDMSTISAFCDRAIYLNKGRLVEMGDVVDVVDSYQRDVMAQNCTESVAARKSVTVPSYKENGSVISDEIDGALSVLLDEQSRFDCRANIDRRGTGAVKIVSFVLLNKDGLPVDVIDPVEPVKACVLIRSESTICTDFHIGLTIKDKCGNPIVVVRDSEYEKPVLFSADRYMVGEMNFHLPLQVGSYYIQVGVLLFEEHTKYQGNYFNFESAEISDLVEFG